MADDSSTSSVPQAGTDHPSSPRGANTIDANAKALADLGVGPARARRRKVMERGLVFGSTLSAFAPIGALIAMLAVLFFKAIPALRYNGWSFFTRSSWNPGDVYSKVSHVGGVAHPPGASFGALPLIVGTLESSAIAICVGFPIAVGAAIMLVEKLPARPASAIGICLEILAGVPSAVIGFWGVFIFGPFLAAHLYPALEHLPDVFVLRIFHGPFAADGEGLFTGGLVLAAMIIPIIAATTRDLLRQVPESAKEGAEALGMTNFEVFRTVQSRWIRIGVIGSAVLGLGRALGETIAIAMVSGSGAYLAGNIYATFTTIAAEIVTQLDGALSDPTGFEIDTLAEVALILFVITLAVNILARLIVRRSARGVALPVGAGF